MIPIHLGRNAGTQEEFYLEPDLFSTHMHLVGATGTGKSTALLTILHHLLLQVGSDKCCLFLIDPIGNLSRDLLRFIAHPVFATDYLRERLVYIEPANDDYVIPFNPLLTTVESARYYQVMRAVDIVLRAWDAQEVRQQPRLLQWTFKAFCTAALLGFPIAICAYLLHPGTEEHKTLLRILPDELRFEWHEILSAKGSEPTKILESTRNRLDPFFKSDHLRRMFGTRTSLFDCRRFIRERKIVILNLGRYGRLPDFIADTIGGLALNEILETASALSTAEGARAVDPTYVVMDEFQRFVGMDIEKALPTVRQMGLRLILAHQSFSQLEREDVDLTNMIWQARSRLVFANSARDADILADELAKLTFDNMTIKDQRTSLKQLIVGYRKEWLESESATSTRSNAEMEQNAVGYNRNWGESLGPKQSRPTKSQGHGDQQNSSKGQTWAASDAETRGRSQANVPIHETIQEVTNVTYLSFDEWALKWGKDIRRLPTGHAFGLFPNDPDVRSLYIHEFPIVETQAMQRRVEELLARNYASEFFLSAAAADRELEDCRRLLLTSPPRLPDQRPPRGSAGSEGRSDSPPDDEPPFR